MFYIKLTTGRYVASYSKLNDRRYTDCLCNFKSYPTKAAATAAAKKYAYRTGSFFTVVDFELAAVANVSPTA